MSTGADFGCTWNQLPTAVSLNELIEQLRSVGDPSQPGGPRRFRGHASRAWRLMSSFDRVPVTLATDDRLSRRRREISLASKFIERSDGFLARSDRRIANGNLLAQSALARHYGLATRVLDWTESAFIAAYFAVASGGADDGTVCWYSGGKFEAAKRDEWLKLFRVSGHVEHQVWSAVFGEAEPPEFVTELHLSQLFPRLAAQAGLFTIGSRFGADHGVLIERLVGKFNCGQVLIPASLKRELLRYLQDFNFSCDSVMTADAHRIAWEVNRELESKLLRPAGAGK